MAQIITINKKYELFPDSFRAIGEDCPKRIYVMGNIDLLKCEHKVAIIGSRKATRKGVSKAYDLALEYASKGYVVVSGLALGCDAAAHRGCMAGGAGTIAIVASGLDLVHPRENISLQEEILRNGGLILSEQPLGIKAIPARLVARNRLQAALSDEVVVAECPIHSGTMHTVRFAQKYGKPIKAAIFPYDKYENSGNRYIINTGIGIGV